MTTADEVKQLILQHYAAYDLKLEDLRLEARFQIDMPDDTMGIVELIMLCEEEFDIEIQDEYAKACSTVGDLINCVENKLKKKNLLGPSVYKNMQLENKVALITGARRGIGRAIALEYARNGADCILWARSAPDELADEIRALGRKAVTSAVDVSDTEAVDAAAKEAIKEFGKVDILVNNAGITEDSLLIRMKLEQWRRVLDVNLTGAFNCCKAVTRPMLKAEYGRIINISSVIGQVGNAGQANYAASKAGLIGFTKSLAKELGSRGITVNAIAPGFIETDMTSELNEEMRTALLGDIPLGRLGEAEDIAHCAVYLASDKARYVTGQVLNVDGGMVM